MKRYAVYGVDSITALKEYDSLEEAKVFAKKGLRKWSKTVKDRETKKMVYTAWKNNRGEIVEKEWI